jgi:hypothetical protein
VIERLAKGLSGTSFHRGLALGALVGAAIAGSTLWARVREVRDRRAPAPTQRRDRRAGG